MQQVEGYFGQLGRLVEERWSRAGRGPGDLPGVAESALLEVDPPSIGASDVLGCLAVGTGIPEKQRPSADRFGQPPAIMYRGEGFEIQALTWMDGTTSIHQHGFDGAFRVLCGSSLHVPYGFEVEEEVADGHLLTGRLLMAEPEILRTGDVRPIPSGFEFVHALFHLERPSVTVVVRNGSSNLPFPQYDYRLPGVGVDALFPDDRLQLRLRGLHSLRRIDPHEARRVAEDIVRSQDLWTGFRVCDDWAHRFGDGADLDELVSSLADRHAGLGALLVPMYREETRRMRLLARRGLLQEERHRLFLALIVNLPDRRSIDAVIGQLVPDQPPDALIATWVRELASPAYRGVSGLVVSETELDVLTTRIEGADGLDTVARRWAPPSLLEKLFV